MKRLLILIVASINLQCIAQELSFSWIKETSRVSIENIGSDITLDTKGNIICIGSFRDSAIFGDTILYSHGLHDIFLAKYDTTGNYLWAIQFGGSTEDNGNAVDVDVDNNILITGNFTNSATFEDTVIYYSQSHDFQNSFVAKLNENGKIIWVRSLSSDHIRTSDIEAVEEEIILFGNYQKDLIIDSIEVSSNSFSAIFLANLDNDGKCRWINTAGGTDFNSSAHSSELTLYDNGNIGITGIYTGKIKFGTDSISDDDTGSFIAKCNSKGEWVWSMPLEGEHGEWAYTIDTDKDDNTLIAGIFDGTAIFGTDTLVVTYDINLFLAKVDSNKNWIFATQSKGNSCAEPHKIIVDMHNNTIVTGWFYYDSVVFDDVTLRCNGEEDVFIGYCDTSGHWLNAISYGSEGSDCGNSVINDDSDNIFISGATSSESSNLKLFKSDDETYNFIGKIIIEKNNVVHFAPLKSFGSPHNFYAYPNPFDTDVSIVFDIEQADNYSLIVFNTNGQIVSRTESKYYAQGTYNMQWREMNKTKNIVQGIYVCALYRNDILMDNCKILKK